MADAQAADATATSQQTPGATSAQTAQTGQQDTTSQSQTQTQTGDQSAAQVQQQTAQTGEQQQAAQTAQSTDWRDGLEGEELEFAKRAASPKDVVKIALDFRKANSSMIRVPGADAKPEDVAKFRKLIGVPEKAEEYKPDLGRDLTDADKAVFDPIAKIMHQHNVPAKAFSEVSKAVVAMAEAQLSEQNRVAVAKREESAAALRKEWGADNDANMEIAKRAVRTFVKDTSILDAVVDGTKLGDHPAIIKAFGEVGRRMGEGDLIGAVGTEERSTIQGRIDQIMRENPVGSDGYKRADVQRELGGLFEKLSGNAPAGAGFGRV